MECPPIARRILRATAAHTISSKMGCRLVLFSCVLLLGESLATQSRHINTDVWYVNCKGETNLIANGECDISLNTGDCGFDGGDCCECTCVLDDGSPCDRTETGLFFCRDPDAPLDCHATTEIQTRILAAASSYPECAGSIPQIKDGRCNEVNNNVHCGFDGGDCCASTCASGLAFACGGEGGGGFDCRDPIVTLSRRRLSSSDSCEGFTSDIGNTRCDSELNNEECGYDGGDCCECTCVPSLTDSGVEEAYITNYCLDGDFNCLDPDANCDTGGEAPTPDPTPGPIYVNPTPNPIYVNPSPSPVYVNPTPTPIYVQPVASPTDSPEANPTVNPVSNPTPISAPTQNYNAAECGSYDSYLGDGDCDSIINTLECGWDGGDCCECTCVETYYYKCTDFDCLDPSVTTDCESESSVPSPNSSGTFGSGPTDNSMPSASSARSYGSDPTERPVIAPTASPTTSSGSDSSPQSGSDTESEDGSTEGGGDAESDTSSWTESSDLDSEEASLSSATLTATTDSSFLIWEVVGAMSASALGYWFM